MRIFRRSFAGSDLASAPARSRRGAEIAGWLFLFGMSGTVYLIAAANNTWVWIPIFAGSLFLVVILGVLWDWMIAGRPLLNARTVILVGTLFWLLLDPLLMRQGLDDFSPDVELRALLYAAFFLSSVCVGYLIRPFRTVKRLFSHIPPETNDDLVFLVIVGIYLIGVLPFITAANSITEFWRLLLAGYSPEIDVAWRRGMLGDRQDFLKSIARLLQLTIPFLSTYLITRRLLVWKKVLLGIMILSLWTVTFFSGERRILALIVLGPLGYLFFKTSMRTLKKWSPVFLLLLFLLFWIMQAQVQFRAAGFNTFDAAKVESNPLEMHRDDNFYWFVMAVQTIPADYEYTHELIFTQLFTHPIPRFIWPGKPYSTGLPFVHWEDVGASLSISVVGELYVSQGILGIIVGGIIYGLLARNWDELYRHLKSSNPACLIYALGLTLLLLGVRSFGDVVLNWYVLVIVMVAFRCLGFRRSPTILRLAGDGLERRASA